METTERKILNRNGLKFLAIIAMTMDHVACTFFSNGSVLWLSFRFIGRITFPVMAYMLADGFRYTRNLKKYILRLFLFSLISWFSFSFLETGSLLPVRWLEGTVVDYPFSSLYISSLNHTLCISRFSVITGLLCALLGLSVWEKTSWKIPWKILATLGLVLVTLNCDWGWLLLPMVFGFAYLRNHKTAMWTVYGLLSLLYLFDIFGSTNLFSLYFWGSFRPYRLGMVLIPVLIEVFYNGKKGSSAAFTQWFFYLYYPAHQFLLGLLILFIE